MKVHVTLRGTRGKGSSFDWIWPHRIPFPRKLKKAVKAQMLGRPVTRRQRRFALRYFSRLARHFRESWRTE